MPVSLEQIISATRRRVEEARRHASFRKLEGLAQFHIPRGLRKALKERSQDGIAVIAEIKKASPSRGLIRADFDAARLAAEFEQSGAAALSVLTDEEFFQGSLANLQHASASASLPCLRKDFIVDDFQILESRAYGADAILLIVAALSDKELSAFRDRAREMELDVLCEVHDAEELRRASGIGFDLIGVNNRDLRTFKVDLETSIRLADSLPDGVVRVAESGIHDPTDVVRLRSAGYQAFLIGESLMKADSPAVALQQLMMEPKAVVAK